MDIKSERTKIWKYLLRRIRDKYRLVLLNEETLEERISFKLSRLNVFVAIGLMSIILVFITTYIIAFTPLKEYIPGYTDVTLQRRIYELQLRSDSVAFAMRTQEKYLESLKKVLGGDIPNEREMVTADTAKTRSYGNIKDKHSPEDSLLRTEYDNANKYTLLKSGKSAGKGSTMRNLTFFSPVKGIITSEFDPLRKHFGVDVVAARDEVIKSVQDGTVIFSGWTVETGYVIAIQHPGNVISIYKHNSVLFKKEGNIVHAGETIAIIGETGELSTGPHLHLELWINGIPVNPKDYIVF
ncbi:MAG: M23 family metallopeptidase [Bacteroidales bacterium]|nr:M23 family metallopeptidase [Bacteroidales bacterium]